MDFFQQRKKRLRHQCVTDPIRCDNQRSTHQVDFRCRNEARRACTAFGLSEQEKGGAPGFRLRRLACGGPAGPVGLNGP
jgi:hypothetical protein